MRDADCIAFLQWALPRLGLRWAGFRKPRRQVCRRIARRLGELGLGGLDDYRARLEADPGEWTVLGSLCRVTISRFLRDRAVFEALDREVLPDLGRRARAAGRSALAAWSAGCASGEEPYSLRLLWCLRTARRLPGLELEVTATETDEHLLDRARRALYPQGSLRELPTAWRDAGFELVAPEAAGTKARYRLREELRRGVELRREDLRDTTPPGPFDVVLCRNLAWTYFAVEVQRGVLERIARVLEPAGVLVVGAHESLPGGTRAASLFEAAGRSIFRKVG